MYKKENTGLIDTKLGLSEQKKVNCDQFEKTCSNFTTEWKDRRSGVEIGHPSTLPIQLLKRKMKYDCETSYVERGTQNTFYNG